MKEENAKDRKFCHTCHLLLLPEEWNDHKTHIIKENLTDEDLLMPSKLLCPIENNKSNAVSIKCFSKCSTFFVLFYG